MAESDLCWKVVYLYLIWICMYIIYIIYVIYLILAVWLGSSTGMNTQCKMMTLQWKLMEFESKTCLPGLVAHVSFNLTGFSVRGQETWSWSPHLLAVACIPETKSWWQDRHVSRRGVHWCVTVSWTRKHSSRNQPKDAPCRFVGRNDAMHWSLQSKFWGDYTWRIECILVWVNISGTCI